MGPLLLAALLQTPDLVVTRDGRRLEGRLSDLGQALEIEAEGGKVTRVYRYEAARIEPGSDYPRCPEVVPLPPDALEKTDYDFASFRHVLLALPKRGGKMLAVDVRSGRRLWEHEPPELLVPPIVAGPTVYLLRIKKDADASRKLKFDGVAQPKEVHRITVQALALDSGETRWEVHLDNNDRKDVYWTVASNPAPTLHVLPDRVMLRVAKDAWPVDAAGNCDKSKPLRYASFVSVDPNQKRVLGVVDSDDAAEAGGRPWYTPELIVLQVFSSGNSWRLVAVGAKDGKRRWESELVAGALHELSDETAVFSDATHLRALALKTGKRLEKPAFELGDARVAEVVGPHAFVYRTKKAPRKIEVVDLKKGTVAFACPIADDDEPAHLRVVGRRLLYMDRRNRIHALDLDTRKEAWLWAGTGPGFAQGMSLIGGALGFYKDGRLTLLDPASGQKIWEVKGSYRAVVPAGDQGFLAVRNPGADLVRRRVFDRPGVFFTPGDTPLRYAWGGDDAWSPPTAVDGLLYTLSSAGTVAAIDPAQRKVVWSERLSRTPVSPLSAPYASDGVLLVNLGAETQAWALSNKGRLYQARHAPLGLDRQLAALDGLWFACASGQPLTAYAIADGKKAWETPHRGVLHYDLVGDTLHAVSPTQYVRVEAKTGATLGTTPLPRGVTAVAADAKRTILAQGPYGFGTVGTAGYLPLWKSKATEPRIGHRFKGHLALAPEGVVYSHADGAVSYWKDGAEKAEWNVTTLEFSSPVLVHGGRAWFAAISVGLAGVDLAEGTYKWKSAVGDAPLFTPILWEGKPAFWSSEGWLIPVKE